MKSTDRLLTNTPPSPILQQENHHRSHRAVWVPARPPIKKEETNDIKNDDADHHAINVLLKPRFNDYHDNKVNNHTYHPHHVDGTGTGTVNHHDPMKSPDVTTTTMNNPYKNISCSGTRSSSYETKTPSIQSPQYLPGFSADDYVDDARLDRILKMIEEQKQVMQQQQNYNNNNSSISSIHNRSLNNLDCNNNDDDGDGTPKRSGNSSSTTIIFSSSPSPHLPLFPSPSGSTTTTFSSVQMPPPPMLPHLMDDDYHETMQGRLQRRTSSPRLGGITANTAATTTTATTRATTATRTTTAGRATSLSSLNYSSTSSVCSMELHHQGFDAKDYVEDDELEIVLERLNDSSKSTSNHSGAGGGDAHGNHSKNTFNDYNYHVMWNQKQSSQQIQHQKPMEDSDFCLPIKDTRIMTTSTGAGVAPTSSSSTTTPFRPTNCKHASLISIQREVERTFSLPSLTSMVRM